MNITKKLYQPFVIEKIASTDWSKGTDGPLIVELDTTESCDLACPGCISEEIMAENKLSSKRLLDLGEELKSIGVKGVVLIGGGEPLAHPAVGDFIRFLGENDIAVGITTNGTFIHKHMEEIARYSNWTRVSMDAATDEMFRILRPTKGGGSKFNLILRNMEELSKRKTGKLGYSFLIRTEIEGDGLVSNIHEIYDAAKLAREIGCDYFEVKPSYQYRNNAVHSLVKHDPKRLEEAKKEIERLNDLVTEDFSIVKAITLDASLRGGEETLQPKDYHICPATELRTLITPSGVYVCPYWRGKSQFNVGDILSSSLEEIWHSERRKEVQAWLDPSKHCGFNCLRHETNLEVFSIIRKLENGETIETVEEYDRFI